MRFFKISLLAVLATLMFVGPASALVTVDAHLTDGGTTEYRVGDTFDVDIDVTWTGDGALLSIFASHEWDLSQLNLVSAVFPLATQFDSRPTLFFGGAYSPGLPRVGTNTSPWHNQGDLDSMARTVQYGTDSAISAGNALTESIVTRLTFEVVGIGDGTSSVAGILLQGDAGANGDSFAFGTNASITIIPEPATALLMGLGLAGLAAAGRRKG